MKSENQVAIMSKQFAIRIIRMYQILIHRRPEKDLLRQVLRSGTSIGANVKEALRGQSKADFGAKMNIALKEASETEYWIELLYETGIISEPEFNSLITDCRALIKILTAIVKSTFKSIRNP